MQAAVNSSQSGGTKPEAYRKKAGTMAWVAKSMT